MSSGARADAGQPRIGLDVTPLALPCTGIGRYTFELLGALWRTDDGPSIVPVGNRPLRRAWLPPGAPARVAGPQLGSRAAWTFGALPLWLTRRPVDIFHGTSFYAPLGGPVPTVVTLHDLSTFALPRTHPAGRVLRARALLGRTARHASAVIVPSDFTARETHRWLDVPTERIHVVPGAPAATFSRTPDEATVRRVIASYEIAAGFLLGLGTVEPRKNLARLVDAVRRLRAGGLPVRLVVAGARGWKSADVVRRAADAAAGADAEIRFLGYVPDGDLRALMACAAALVYPSLYEGFGLPVVEAMAAGLPVLTSRGGALEEVAGGAALLVDPRDTDGLAAGMAALATDAGLRQRLARAGRQRAAAFTWERSARETLDVYRAVIREQVRR